MTEEERVIFQKLRARAATLAYQNHALAVDIEQVLSNAEGRLFEAELAVDKLAQEAEAAARAKVLKRSEKLAAAEKKAAAAAPAKE